MSMALACIPCRFWEPVVVFLTVFAYFALIAAVVSLAIFPGLRARVGEAVTGIFQVGVSRIQWGGAQVSGGVNSIRLGVKNRYDRTKDFIVQHPMVASAAVCAIVVPTGLVFTLHRPVVFDYGEVSQLEDRQISVLLNGEQLVPPAPLPPEMFTTREVEMVRPDVINASRNWVLLEPEFMQRLLVVFKLMKERHGYEMVLVEGYRSPERQAQLFAQGGHVTQAAANMSYHQYGLAADSAFLRQGKVVIAETDPWAMRGYQLYGEIAEQVGLVWGGRWKMLDYGHVELRRPGTLAHQR